VDGRNGVGRPGNDGTDDAAVDDEEIMSIPERTAGQDVRA
jgi:hypothetical protein